LEVEVEVGRLEVEVEVGRLEVVASHPTGQ
jgi:hypothetical protein